MRKYLEIALLVSIGINIALFALGCALGSKQMMLLALLSSSACMIGLITKPDNEDG